MMGKIFFTTRRATEKKSSREDEEGEGREKGRRTRVLAMQFR